MPGAARQSNRGTAGYYAQLLSVQVPFVADESGSATSDSDSSEQQQQQQQQQLLMRSPGPPFSKPLSPPITRDRLPTWHSFPRGHNSFVACPGHWTNDHASLSRRGTVPAPNRKTSPIWALKCAVSVYHIESFCYDGGHIVNRTYGIHTNLYIYNHFHQQYSVLLTMVPRKSLIPLPFPTGRT